jgi:hypothetical protein
MRPPICSSGVGLGCHLHFNWCGILIHNTVTTWSARSLSTSGSADTSATHLMKTFQFLSHSASGCISASGRSHVCKVCPWGAIRQAFWRLALLCRDSAWLVLLSGESIQKHKQKAVVLSSFFKHQLGLPSHLTARGGGGYSMSVSYDALFFYISSTYRKPASTIPPLDLPLVSTGTSPEGMTIFPDSGQVGGS